MANLHEHRLKGQCKKDGTVETSDRGGDELIGRKDKRELHREIVFGESGSGIECEPGHDAG